MGKRNTMTDLTKGPVLKTILLFAIPVIIGNYLQELYNTVDTLIVGHTLGVVKLAAVGTTSSLSFLALGFLIGSAAGYAVPVSQFLGAGDMEKVKRSVAANFLIAAGETILFTLVFSLCAKPLLKLLNTPLDAFPFAYKYLIIIYLGIPANVLYNTLACILRAAGDSKTPLYFLVFSSLLNIGLDFLCIMVFKWDIAGAAIATVFSQLISACLCVAFTFKRFPMLIPQKEHFKDIGKDVVKTLKIGVPMGLQSAMVSLGVMLLAGVLNGFGSSAVAGNSIGFRVQRLIEMTTVSIGTVVSTFVAQNYGAGDYGRIRSGVRKAWLFCLGYHIVMPALAWLLRNPLIALFLGDEAADATGFALLHLKCLLPFMWFLSFLHVYRAAVIGLGKGIASFLGGIAELVMRFVFGIILAPIIGYAAIALTGPGAWLACAIMMVIMYVSSIKKLKPLEAN